MSRFLRSLLPGIPLAAAAFPLAAQAPCFSSTGGPNGDFDWVVRTGEIFFFDTSRTVVLGGPNGAPTSSQTVIGGTLEVRNLLVEPGGEIRVQGPNPLRVQASGDVIVRGRIDLSGFNAKDVATLNTGNQVELGGAGGPSGGRGGNANILTDQSSPRGGAGSGPFGLANLGAEGGESAYASAVLGKNARRPGGGGGGKFAADRTGEAAAEGQSLVATAGGDGNPTGLGAESGQAPARGGAPGLGAFDDAKPENDFWGFGPRRGPRGRLAGRIRGELAGLWAGYGGGGGGNAVPATEFPNPNYTFATDEKGGGGGGGGGALHIQALGRIAFGAEGRILAHGARGGTGENTNFLDHIGGTGGGGSGGHIVLESAQKIDFTDGGANLSGRATDWVTAYGPARKTGNLNFVDPCCREQSNGGAGGAGVLQLHVPRPELAPSDDPLLSDIVVPTAVAVQRRPLDQVSSPEAYALYPTCRPPAPLGWLGTGARGGLASFLRIPMTADEPSDARLDLAAELVPLELPRRR
jgi:hypothetical protein